MLRSLRESRNRICKVPMPKAPKPCNLKPTFQRGMRFQISRLAVLHGRLNKMGAIPSRGPVFKRRAAQKEKSHPEHPDHHLTTARRTSCGNITDGGPAAKLGPGAVAKQPKTGITISSCWR
jgi:hypothetical protein